MPNPESLFRNLLRTIAGAVIGATISLFCWLVIFALATIDDAAHWKGTLIGFGVLLPIFCVAVGVVASRPYVNRSNYLVANLGGTILATLLTVLASMALLSRPLWTGLLFSIPAFFLWTFIEKRYISAIINTCAWGLWGQTLFTVYRVVEWR